MVKPVLWLCTLALCVVVFGLTGCSSGTTKGSGSKEPVASPKGPGGNVNPPGDTRGGK
jgi:hypothetical protein